MQSLIQDLSYGFRLLLKRPGFTLVAIITLALGIGANTAIFSVVHTLLLRSLPFNESDRLVVLAETSHTGKRFGVSYPDYKDWLERAGSFQEMAAYSGQSFNLTGFDRPVRLEGRIVNWNFFQLLGVKPQLGRTFVEQDDQPGAAGTAMISHGLWKEKFGGDPNVIGKPLIIDGEQHTVIGVLQSGFELFRKDDIFIPFGPSLTDKSGLLDRGNHFDLYILARLKDGVSTEQAHKEVETLAAQLAREYPNTNSGQSAMAQGLKDVLVMRIRPALLVLLGAVGFVLLIACVNVANLMLVRAADRQREIAIRLALGASRRRIFSQLINESLVLSILGGLAGLLVGFWVKDGLLALAPPDIPRIDDVGLDSTVLIFTFTLSVLTGLIFGLLPAFYAVRIDLNSTLKQGGQRTTSSREGLRKILLAAEVGMALVLLVGAGLMLRTVYQLMHVDPGFKTENLLTMRFILPGKTYDQPRRRAFYGECISRVEALPGVQSAALTLSLPIEGSNWNSIFIAADKPVPPRAELPSSAFTPVSASFFDTMGIRLLKGRLFSGKETADSSRVIVINETLARRIWPDEDPIGKQLKQGWPEDESPWREVIGVVADVKLNGVDRETPLQTYLPLMQEPPRSLSLLVRTERSPLAMASTVEQSVYSLDKDLPVFNIRSMDELLGNAIAQQRLAMALLSGFAILALILAAIGIYGVVSYSASRRTQEIGIRMALGAQSGDVLKLIIRQGMLPAFVGLAAGLLASLALSRLMEKLLFGVSATDPMTFTLLFALLAAVAFIACYIPAQRATKVDPMVALRYE